MANPFIAMDTSNTSSTFTESTLPILKEWAWDFNHDRFLLDSSGNMKIVEENEALKVWIYKALKTQRYRYQCYKHGIYNADSNYGIDLEKYIGQTNNTENAGHIIEEVKSCLEINPYIESIDSVEVTRLEGDIVEITIALTSIYGSTSTSVKM